MSLLILVRHGKASPLSDDYDNLSDIGIEQARLLGEHWADSGLLLDAVHVGPRKRHVQTHDAIAEIYRRRGLAWPEPAKLAGLDEHDGISLVFKSIPKLAETDDSVRAVAEAMGRGETPPLHGLLAVFKRLTRRWVRGELSHDDVESWPLFRARVAAALRVMSDSAGRGKTVAAFTSAGVVAAAVGEVLGIADEKVIELSWALHNGSVSELAFSEGAWGLRTFNATPHLTDPKLVTSV